MFGSGVVLTELRDSDAGEIAAACGDPETARFLTTPFPYTYADAAWFIETGAPEGWRSGTEWTWAIRRSAVGPLLGVIALRLPSGALGFWLAPEHRGAGIMSASVVAVTAVAFERVGLEKVRWEAHVGNWASRAVAERAGFTMLGERVGTEPDRSGAQVQCWAGELSRAGFSAQ